MASTVKRSSFLTALFDPFQPTGGQADAAFRPSLSTRAWALPALIAVALLVMSAVGWAIDAPQFYFSYHVGWVFCLSLSIGALFFIVIQHLTKARWSVVVRRIAEVLAYMFPLLAIMSIPTIIGMHDLFHWTHHELYDPLDPHYDPIIAGKHAYLNVPFFLARLAIYFVAWTILSYRLYTLSLRQDVDPDPNIPAKLRATSAWGLPLLAVTTAFASYDLLMSLDPHWFSTIFGVYFFAGAFWVMLAFLTFTVLYLQRGGMLREVVTKEHYQDLGKLMFGFTVFWAYIAFSQYMLIWYGNLPEETVWFRHRLEHGWGYHSAALLVLHFIVPFWLLIPRAPKRVKGMLGFMVVYFFIMQWFDLHWLSMPILHGHEAGFHWLDFTTWLGLFGVFLAVFLWRLGRHSLVPQRDPYLAKSLAFHNT